MTQQFIEFFLNNLILSAGFIFILGLVIKAEVDHQANKENQRSPTQAIRLINNHNDIVIIDARATKEFKKGHIKGARNVPITDFNAKISSLSQYKDKPILLYCNTGTSISRAIRLLKKAGFNNINNIEGGIMAWNQASLPLTTK
jgi:rhodanese-related sulfurtransferase